MRDERLDRLSDLLLNYSLKLQPGDLFEINGGVPAKPLIKSLLRRAHAIGAVPFVKLGDDEISRLFFGFIDPEHPERARHAIDAQLEWENRYWDHMVAHVDIGVDENDAELSAVDTRAR
jgi:aminopeptidase